MLKKLVIKNYALIEELEIDFGGGLSIVTGETGAGKSIMLGALGLLLGERADTKAIADKERKTIVEATFELDRPSETLATAETEHIELIVRREISPSGRSRAFVDDSPVTLLQLSGYTSHLLDIHSQHANLSLASKEGQLRIIDAMADNAEALADYREIFKNYVAVRNRLRRLREEKARNEERRAAVEYQLRQLRELNVKEGEQEEVERQFDLLNDADEIREHLRTAHWLLNGADQSALAQISEAFENLEEVRHLVEGDINDEETLPARLSTIAIEVKDIADTLERRGDMLESNPALLARTAARMRELYDAAKAFNVKKADELIPLREKLERTLSLLDGSDDETQGLEREERQLGRLLKEMADRLTESRRSAALAFSGRLTERAIPLGLPNLRFEVGMTRGKLTLDGQDSVEFLCSFNKNGMMLPMATTASGGELSRLTLSIKSLMAEKMDMPTVIFDEIDTGVSGEIAAKMGRMMVEMGQQIQIIAITHLPQVAAKGERHYKVSKRDTDERTVSTVVELTPDQRVREIAGMLSGEHITEEALSAARALCKL